MTLIERYIFKFAFLTFVISLVVLTAVIWLTQAMKQFDLMTDKGQTLLIFFRLTGLFIPSMVMVIAPISLFMATLFSLNKLNSDSELVVAASAGLSPFQLFRPFAALMLLTTAFCAFISLWAMPTSFYDMRELLNRVQSDFLTRIVRPGAFNTLEPGLVFHYRERGPGGALRGVFMYDTRENDQKNVYLAENAVTAKIGHENYLVLQTGTIQRQDKGARAPAMITFDSYALDLSHFGVGAGSGPLWPRERSTEAMLHYDMSDPYVRANEGKFRADLNDRFIGPLYALAMGMIAFAALGAPQTTRQNRGFAIAGAVACAVILRVAGFGATAMMGHYAAAVPFAYALPLVGCLLATLYAFRASFERRFGRGRPELAAA